MVKVSEDKIYFGDRTGRLSDRLDVGDYERGRLRMTSRFLAYVTEWVEVPFSKMRKLGEGTVPGCVCHCLFLTHFI